MNSSITAITRRLHATKFGKTYPRFKRASTLSPATEIDTDALGFTFVPAGYELFLALPPRGRWTRSLELNAQEYIKVFNQPLMYRALKLLHGAPDVVTALGTKDLATCHPVDWSYTLVLGSYALCEVRSKHYSRVHLDFWTPRLRAAEKKGDLAKLAGSFCAAITEFVEQNGHIWDEGTDLPASEPSKAISNVAAEKYRSAERLLSAATLLDQRPAARPIPVAETLDVSAVGYLYAAAATQFFVALEALVNLLYTLLLRPEFQSRTYERLTVRSEIDLRLVAMHVFCTGFSAQTVLPGSELWQRIVDLRNFRNDLLHGNVLEEHMIYSFTEDNFLFFYSPSTDFRGRKLQAKAERSLPRAQTRIVRRTVESIKATVDDVRSALLAAMDQDTAQWVQSWISTPFVPPRT